MSWLDKIFQKLNRKTTWARMLNGFTPIFSQFGDNIYASDVVMQAVSCIVDEMKKLNPVHVRYNGDDPVPINDDVQWVLNNPNPIMTKTDMIEKTMWMLIQHYNAFIIPVYDVWTDEAGAERRNYRALYPVQPQTVTFIEDAAGTLFVKMDFANNYSTTLPYADVIHLKWRYSVNEFMGGDENGNPNHASLLKTLEINHDLLQGVGKAMKSSFAVNGVVKYNTVLDGGKTDAALKEFESRLLNSESGILPLDLKAEYVPIAREIQMVDAETLKFIDEKILRTWGVPLPILTGDYTPQQYEAFYQKTIEPFIATWSDEFTRVLFTERKRQFGNKVMFYPKNLIFMSMDQTIEMVRLLGDSGSLYENEKRAAFGLRPLPELAGVRMQSLNYVSSEYAREYQTGNNVGGTNNGEGNGTEGQTGTDQT